MELIVAAVMMAVLLFVAVPAVGYADQAPPLMLAKDWRESLDPVGYLVSEKLDGVRGYWDGTRLISRSGLIIRAPAWFTANFPSVPLDGELWAGRGSFQTVSGLVRSLGPVDDDAWRQVRFMVFDLPDSPAGFQDRYWVMKTAVAEAGIPWLGVVEQTLVKTPEQLQQQLDDVLALGGEGLMLRRSNALYQVGRSDTLLKVKKDQDAEGTVIGYVPGKGKYEGMVGSLKVRLDNGRVIRLGSGLSDADRSMPPTKGSRVTFTFNGYTSTGLPRFARFERVRPEE